MQSGSQFSQTVNQAVGQLNVTDKAESAFQRNFGLFERKGATYSWKIHRPGLRVLTGHSRGKDQAEMEDKFKLVQNCVSRLIANGYLKQGMSIEVYQNFSRYDADSIRLFTLRHTLYEPNPDLFAHPHFIEWLKSIYAPEVDTYARGIAPATLAPKRATPEQAAQIAPVNRNHIAKLPPLDKKRKFRNEDELGDYAAKMLEAGHPRGEVTAFYQEVSIAMAKRSQ